MLDLEAQAETFVGGCIDRMITRKYWKTLKYCLTAATEKMRSQCRIGEAFFTSIAIIGGKIYINHPKI